MSLQVSQAQPSEALKEQIRAMLHICRRATMVPTMSIEELAIAIITVKPEITLVELQRHILKKYEYYNNASVECSMTRGYQGSIVINQFNSTFNDLLRRFDLPIEVSPADPDDDEDEDQLYVNPAAAQMFLHKHLTPSDEAADKDKRPFPFLKLPVEIRLQIYGYCVGLPKSGVAVRQASRHSTKKEIVVRSKDFNAELQMSDWEDRTVSYGRRRRYEWMDHDDGTFKCQDLRTHLALLTVNKEIFNEAMPVFYSINSFVCSDLVHLEDFLATLAPERREQLKHISFFYTTNTHSKAAKAFKMLGEIEKLKRLDIMIDEEAFKALNKLNGKPQFPDVLKLPGFHTLKSMRAVKTVQFHGKCDTIRDALQSWVVDNEVKAAKPKPKSKPRAKRAKKVVEKVVVVLEDSSDDDSSDYSSSEDEQALFGIAHGQEEAFSDMEDQDTDSDSDSTLPSTHYYGEHFSSSSPPPIRAAKEASSPFRFNPTNSGSHLASRFHIPSAARGGHSMFSGYDSDKDMTASGKNMMLSGSPTPSQYEDEDEKEFHKTSISANKPKPKSKNVQNLENFKMPDISTRIRMHGPGQMGDWRTKPGDWHKLQAQAQTPSPSPTFMQHSFMQQQQAAGFSNLTSQLEDPFVDGGDGTVRMEDLLADQDEYELMQ